MTGLARARTTRRRCRAAAVSASAAGAFALAGCGDASLLHPGGDGSPARGSGVPPAAVRVIEAWSQALRAGRVDDAARYFQVPSVFFDGSGAAVELRTRQQVEAVNAALSCGAVFLSAHTEGIYVNVLFRLTNRPGPGGGHGCGAGTGETARTDFLIRRGRIVEWLRAPDEPGDNGSPRTSPSPGTPAGTVNPVA